MNTQGLWAGVLLLFAALFSQFAWAQDDIDANSVVTAIAAGLPSKAQVSVSDIQMKSSATNLRDWLLHGRTYKNDRYSPLRQINSGNVNALAPAAVIQTGMLGGFEATPIVVDGTMYVTTPVVDHQMKIQAFDAASGALLWTALYTLDVQKACCGPVNRGVAVGYGLVFVATLNARLLAFDCRTGKLIWKAKIADPRTGISETMAPQVYNGLVIVGSSGGEWPIRGFVAAYDAKTGKAVWRWYSTDPNTFEGDSWKTGGGTVWTTPAIDVKQDLVIFSVGNPNPDFNGESRKGSNLYTDSIVALHAKTGKLAWYFQEVKHDLWDFDAASNVVLFDAKDERGKYVPAAGEAGKVGYFFIVNRVNGAFIRKTAFVQMSGNAGKSPTEGGVVFAPGPGGGAEWSPPAYSPLTHDVYILGGNQPFKVTKSEPMLIPGQQRWGSTLTPVLEQQWSGNLTAINVDSGAVHWKVKTKQLMVGGALATGGNLVFAGEADGWFDAFDSQNGFKLWHFQLGAGANAPPITYQVNGTQYVAVAAGGNDRLHTQKGDAIVIFKLPNHS